MFFDSYTISFCPGSSGRFIFSILYNMIMGNDTVIDFSENNNAHFTNVEMNAALVDIHNANVFEMVTFNDNLAKILFTHQFPNINIIRERFKYKMGVIVINLKPTDLYEVLYNSFLKNKNIELTGLMINNMAKLKLNQWKNFIDVTPLSGQPDILILEYSKLFDLHEGEYITLKKLEQFTGLKSNIGSIKTLENYAKGRQKLIDAKMPWLCELQRNLDK